PGPSLPCGLFPAGAMMRRESEMPGRPAMTTSTATVARALQVAVEAGLSGPRDAGVLRRCAGEEGQDPLAAPGRRPAGVVVGVCRRALGSAQDAEDACQATFLVLLRQARSQRWQPSVANWLHTTARRVAHNARLSAQRRARREGRVAVHEAVLPADAVGGC